jgi:hypothetical protein
MNSSTCALLSRLTFTALDDQIAQAGEIGVHVFVDQNLDETQRGAARPYGSAVAFGAVRQRTTRPDYQAVSDAQQRPGVACGSLSPA